MASQNRRHSRGSDGSKTLWDYLNSPFGIWFLSSFIVTGITLLGTYFHGYLQSSRLKEEKRGALALEISIRYRDFLENCKTANADPTDWGCYNKLLTAWATLKEPQYKLLQFKGAGIHELGYEMRLLDNAKGVQLENAYDEIRHTLTTCYPYTVEDRNRLFSKLTEIVDRKVRQTLAADVGATPHQQPTPTPATPIF
jgi:hypothetical protein